MLLNDPDVILAVILPTLIILVLIAIIIISIFAARNQRNKQQIELMNTKLSYEKELRKVETEVSEQMMKQFSQEIHDNIGQLLTCIRLSVENGKADHPALSNVFEPVDTYLDAATLQLRLLSRSMNPDFIAVNGMLGAIRTEVNRVSQLKRVKIHLDERYEGDLCIDKNKELMIFRIFQEAINNALKHSKARNIAIDIHVTNVGSLFLQIKDDGKGFSKEQVIYSTVSSGIRNMLNRAAMAAIEVEIDTEINKGVTITISNR